MPVPSGGTEQLLWGCGVDNILPIEARNNRGTGTFGIYGWLAGENGYGTEDACINDGDFELADLGDLVTGESAPFNAAFDSNAVGGPNGCAANTWVRVDIDCDANGTRVYFNGVEFFNEVNGIAQPGHVMIGYEDPFGSISASPDGQWGLLDNFRVTTPAGCGTIGSSSNSGAPATGEILNGSAPPAISAPLTCACAAARSTRLCSWPRGSRRRSRSRSRWARTASSTSSWRRSMVSCRPSATRTAAAS